MEKPSLFYVISKRKMVNISHVDLAKLTALIPNSLRIPDIRTQGLDGIYATLLPACRSGSGPRRFDNSL
jgi:hypothetical protein